MVYTRTGQEYMQVYCQIIYKPDITKAIPAITEFDINGSFGRIMVRKMAKVKKGELVLISRNYTNFLIKPDENKLTNDKMPYVYGVPKFVSKDIADIHPFKIHWNRESIPRPYLTHYSDIITAYTSAEFLIKRSYLTAKFELYDMACSDLLLATTMYLSTQTNYMEQYRPDFIKAKKLWDMFKGAGTIHEGSVAIKKCYEILQRLSQTIT